MAGFITSGEIGHLEGAVAGTENALVTLESWGGTIRGRVLDGAGEPVGAGVAVNAGKFERGLCGTRGRGYDSGTRTRDDGSYFIEFLTSGDFTVTAYREAAGKKESARADLVPEGSTEVELRLGPTPREPRESLERPAPDRSRYRPAMTSISGRVVRPEGTEWPEWLTVEFLSIGGKVCKAVYVDKNGVFDTGTMEPGTYTVRAVSGSGLECGARAGVESGSRDVEIAIGSHGSITGQVFLPDGAPAGAGLYVHALVTGFPKVPHFPGNSGSTRTREDGTFRIDFLGEGAFSLRAVPGERRGLLSSWPVDDIRPDTKGLALRLVESAAIAGVLLAADGAPCHPCEIRAVQEGRGEGECVRTNTKGVFNFTKIAAGKFRVLANPRVDEHRNDGQKWPSIDLGEFESPATDLRLELPRE
jgi:hypothetical protein